MLRISDSRETSRSRRGHLQLGQAVSSTSSSDVLSFVVLAVPDCFTKSCMFCFITRTCRVALLHHRRAQTSTYYVLCSPRYVTFSFVCVSGLIYSVFKISALTHWLVHCHWSLSVSMVNCATGVNQLLPRMLQWPQMKTAALGKISKLKISLSNRTTS